MIRDQASLTTTAAEKALAEARLAHAEVLRQQARIEARQPQLDNIAAELAAHLAWMRQNPDAVSDWLRPSTTQTPKEIQ